MAGGSPRGSPAHTHPDATTLAMHHAAILRDGRIRGVLFRRAWLWKRRLGVVFLPRCTDDGAKPDSLFWNTLARAPGTADGLRLSPPHIAPNCIERTSRIPLDRSGRRSSDPYRLRRKTHCHSEIAAWTRLHNTPGRSPRLTVLCLVLCASSSVLLVLRLLSCLSSQQAAFQQAVSVEAFA